MKAVVIVTLAAIVAATACQQKPAGPLVPADYRQWTRVTREPLRYAVPGHLENARVIYINSIGLQRITKKVGDREAYEYPQGTIIVKEVFPTLQADVSGVPQALTVMIKASGHKLARGGWVWVVVDPASGNERVIDYQFCFECHGDANEAHPYGDKNPEVEFRDFVFLPYQRP